MNPLPDDCAIAFKEWAGVCQALGDGRQTIIVRKGGIDEGPAGFRPEHRGFLALSHPRSPGPAGAS